MFFKSVLYLKSLALFAVLLFVSGCVGTGQPMKLINNNDGTILDSKHKLLWQQDRSPLIINSIAVGEYIDEINRESLTSWRLPTMSEFHNLYFTYDHGSFDRENGIKKMSGKFWVIAEDNKMISGSWDDKGVGCCKIREFSPGLTGYIRLVKNI